MFSTDVETHLQMTDNEVMAGLFAAARTEQRGPTHIHARRIVERQHFKVVYERNPEDVRVNPEAGRAVFGGLVEEFQPDYIRSDHYRQRSGAPDFPVRMRDDDVVSSLRVSETLNQLPVVSMDYVYVERSLYERARRWVDQNREQVIQPQEEADGG